MNEKKTVRSEIRIEVRRMCIKGTKTEYILEWHNSHEGGRFFYCYKGMIM